jgi:phage tail sheath protein FI
VRSQLEKFSNLNIINSLVFCKNKGLVKLATPCVTSTTVTSAGVEYAEARNYSYKVEIPSNIVSESSAINHINTTIGRSEYSSTHFPSWGYVLDANAEPSQDNIPMVLVPLVGMILGREALVAQQFDGYHKAPAGIDVTLPDVLELTTGDAETGTALNEEQLNPVGINVVKFRQGSVILWGDRTLSPTSEWQWLHQRYLMSYYENVLRESFDFIIFAINDKQTQELLKPTFREFFQKEWRPKRAIRGNTLSEAFQLKIDEENNTDATRAAGDLNAEITLRLADTVERFKIVVSKSGIFDSVE